MLKINTYSLFFLECLKCKQKDKKASKRRPCDHRLCQECMHELWQQRAGNKILCIAPACTATLMWTPEWTPQGQENIMRF